MSAYRDLLSDLFSRRKTGMTPGFSAVSDALNVLGEPQLSYLSVQVGGTNGKGTTCFALSKILDDQGISCGRFSSPHLCRFTERFSVRGRESSQDEVLACYQALRDCPQFDSFSFFELATLLSVLSFARAKVDVGIFEVGLGGRFDSTTALVADICAVTGVAFDHQEFLGTSLESIAMEKAGIFRHGQRAFIGSSGIAQGRTLLVEQATERGSEVCELPDLNVVEWQDSLGVGLLAQNCALAEVLANEVCRQLGFAAPPDGTAARYQMPAMLPPGRLERCQGVGDRHYIVDGAHNPDAARALGNALAQLELSPATVVYSGARDKEHFAFLKALLDSWPNPAPPRLHLAPMQHTRGADVSQLEAAAKEQGRGLEIHSFATIKEACEAAGTGSARPTLVTGSLFAVAEFKRELLGEPSDPLRVSESLKYCSG